MHQPLTPAVKWAVQRVLCRTRYPRELAVPVIDLPNDILWIFPSEKQEKALQQRILHTCSLSAALTFCTGLAPFTGKAGSCVGHQHFCHFSDVRAVETIVAIARARGGSTFGSSYCWRFNSPVLFSSQNLTTAAPSLAFKSPSPVHHSHAKNSTVSLWWQEWLSCVLLGEAAFILSISLWCFFMHILSKEETESMLEQHVRELKAKYRTGITPRIDTLIPQLLCYLAWAVIASLHQNGTFI